MFTRIIRHDLRLLASDRSLALVAALFTLLLAYAMWNGAGTARARGRAIGEAAGAAAAELDIQRQQVIDVREGRKSAADIFGLGRPSNVQVLAALPPAPLAPLSLGASELLPYAATVNIFSTKDELVKQSELDNPLNLLAGRFDPAFLFVYLYPLLVLALSYNLLSQEKEQGTLALTMAQPVSLARLIAGKTIARAGLLLALASAATLVALILGGVRFADGEVATRFLLWLAALAAYTCFWFALAAVVNLFGRSSAANAATLAAAWLALVVIYPALLNAAATMLHPLPSRLHFINDARDAENETNREARTLLARYMNDHPELASGDVETNVKDFQLRYFVQKQELERRAFAQAAGYEAQLARQQTTINRFGFFSPAITLQETMNDLAGTSRRRHERFTAQVRGLIDAVRDQYAPLVSRRATLDADDYLRAPRFTFRDETGGEVARGVLWKILLLTAPALALVLFAAQKSRHYPLAG